MAEAKNKHDIIFIKRRLDTWDGKMISYLKSSPFARETDFSELVMDTIRSRWLPLALLGYGERSDKLKQTGIWAIAQLESQISIIRQICGIENPGAAYAHSLIIPMGQAQSLPQQSPQIKREELAIEHKTAEDVDETDENKDKDEDEDEDDFLDLELTEQMSKNRKRFGGS